MEKSESISELTKSLIKAQGELNSVVKDTKAYNYLYATLPAVIEEYKKHFLKYGLAVIQSVEGNGLRTTLAHESGEWISSVANLMPIKNDPQAQGSAITYMRRYALSAICGIVSEEDDDGAAAQPKQEAKPESKPVEKKHTDMGAMAPREPITVSGKIVEYWPPKNKGPHTFKVGSCLIPLKTFDEKTAESLLTHKESDESVSVTHEMVNKNGYTNAMILKVELHKEEDIGF